MSRPAGREVRSMEVADPIAWLASLRCCNVAGRRPRPARSRVENVWVRSSFSSLGDGFGCSSPEMATLRSGLAARTPPSVPSSIALFAISALHWHELPRRTRQIPSFAFRRAFMSNRAWSVVDIVALCLMPLSFVGAWKWDWFQERAATQPVRILALQIGLLLLFSIALGKSKDRTAFGVLIDEACRISLGRLQAFLWTLIIVSGIA